MPAPTRSVAEAPEPRSEELSVAQLEQYLWSAADILRGSIDSNLQRQMRSQIKRQLRASGIAAEAVESMAAEIVDLAKVRTDR